MFRSVGQTFHYYLNVIPSADKKVEYKSLFYHINLCPFLGKIVTSNALKMSDEN